MVALAYFVHVAFTYYVHVTLTYFVHVALTYFVHIALTYFIHVAPAYFVHVTLTYERNTSHVFICACVHEYASGFVEQGVDESCLGCTTCSAWI